MTTVPIPEPHTCETCGAPSTTTRTEGGSTPTYILCAECASAFDEEVARAAEVAERHAAYHPCDCEEPRNPENA